MKINIALALVAVVCLGALFFRWIAWRIAKDWLEAQLALEAIGAAKLEQIMMPFAVTDGKTFYQHMLERSTLALPAPEKGEPKNVTDV